MTKRIHARPVVSRRVMALSLSKGRDKIYDADYIGKGGEAKRKAKNDNGALSRVKPGSAAVFICELCELSGLTLVELRAHYRRYHGDGRRRQ